MEAVFVMNVQYVVLVLSGLPPEEQFKMKYLDAKNTKLILEVIYACQLHPFRIFKYSTNHLLCVPGMF